MLLHDEHWRDEASNRFTLLVRRDPLDRRYYRAAVAVFNPAPSRHLYDLAYFPCESIFVVDDFGDLRPVGRGATLNILKAPQ